jgi:hypothetical protein
VSLLVAIITVALLGLVIFVLSAPLRTAGAPRHEAGVAPAADASPGREPAAEELLARDELESAREAKYREIRDAELDYRTGKLSREDYDAVDGDLREEALEILNRLERSRAERVKTDDEDDEDAPVDRDERR